MTPAPRPDSLPDVVDGSEPSVEGPLDPAWTDPAKVLTELAQLDADLKSRKSTSVPSVAASGAPAAVYSEDSPPAPSPDQLTPHLEERIELASASLVQLGAGLRAMDDQWRTLRAEADRLEAQMDGAAQELEFLREKGGASPATPAPQALLSSPSEALAARSAAHRPHVDAPYGEFTADRYTRTVRAVKSRRRSMAAWTVGCAVIISGALLTFTYLAHEAAPVLWIALLPLVWLIPVPFFLVSFRATQRIIAQDALDLAGTS